jgi:hypothetical protein
MALSLECRLWAKVDIKGLNDCWEFTGARPVKNYGRLADGKGGRIRAHVAAWILTYGPVPDGHHVLHHCDNPPCCNPRHLFTGTNADNIRDSYAKGRRKSPFSNPVTQAKAQCTLRKLRKESK